MSTVYLQPAAVDLMDEKILAEPDRKRGLDYIAPIGFGDSFKGHPIVGATAKFAILAGKRPLTKGKVLEKTNKAVWLRCLPRRFTVRAFRLCFVLNN